MQDRIPQDAEAPRTASRVKVDFRAAAWMFAAGAAAAWAAVFGLLGVAAAPHLACRVECPPMARGVGLTLGLAVLWLTVMSICGVLAMIPREDPKTGYILAAVAGFVIATIPGVVAVHWLRTGHIAVAVAVAVAVSGPPAPPGVWAAAPDRASDMPGLGLWSVGSTVVRVQQVGLRGWPH